jgi:hypothetical protein
MPKHVIEDAMVTLNSVDISNRVKKVTFVTAKRSPQEATGMTDSWEERIGVDIRSWRCSLDLFQDYSTASVFGVLRALLDSTVSSGLPIVVRPTTAARGTTNPEFQGSVLLDGDYPLIDAEVGAVNMAPVNLLGNGALSIVTTSS